MNLIKAANPSLVPAHIAQRGVALSIRERLLQTLLVLVAIATLLGYIYLAYSTIQQRNLSEFLLFTGLAGVVLGFIAFRNMPYNLRAGVVLFTLLATSMYTFTITGLNGNGKLYLLVFNALAAVFLGFKAGIFSLVVSQAGLAVLGFMMVNGWMALPPNAAAQGWTDRSEWIVTWVILGLLSSLLTAFLGLLLNDLAKVIQHSNQLSQDLEKERSSLQARVDDRTKEIQGRMRQIHTASELSQSIISIQDIEKQLPQVVERIRQSFDLYYVGYFMVDMNNDARLIAATGEAGQKMMAAGHHLPVGGASMIGWSIANRQSRIALDVGTEAVRFNNPYLPETRSEMALPIVQRDQALGALTIQSIFPQAFNEEDIRILEGITNSLGIAIENSRLYQQAQESLEEVRVVNRQYLHQAWSEVQQTSGGLNYVFENLEEPSQGAQNTIQLPLSIRNQVIGQVTLETGYQELTPEQAEIVEAITTQTALALENARLLEETQRRAVQEQTLNQLTSDFSRAFNVEDILKTAVQQLGKLPSVSEVSVRLVSPALQRSGAQGLNGNGHSGNSGEERAV